MTHGRLLVVLGVVCIPIACGDGNGGGNNTLTIRGVWETYVRVDCAKGHQCRAEYPGTQADFEYDYGASVAECLSDIQSAEFDATVSAYEAAAAAGRLSYDPARANACFDAWAAQGCGPYWLGTDPSLDCDEIFKGTVPTGGACIIPDECVSATCTDQMTCS